MKTWAVIDAEDTLILTQTSAQPPAPGPRQRVAELIEPPPPPGQTRLKVVDGRVIDTGEPLIEDTYASRRRAEYPPVEEQLDMLWHAMHEGALPRVEPFYSTLLAVKTKHRKGD